MRSLFIIFILVAFFGCSGYRVRSRDSSMLENAGIRSIAIPMMINKSTYPQVSGLFTSKTVELLSSSSRVEILPGDDMIADAVLIGVISSPAREGDSFKTSSSIGTSAIVGAAENRSEFFVPTSSRYRISVRYFLLKKPSQNEVRLMQEHGSGQLEKALVSHPKVVFNKTFEYTAAFNRETGSFGSNDSAGVVNYSKTKRFFHQSLVGVASRSARDLKELILNVF